MCSMGDSSGTLSRYEKGPKIYYCNLKEKLLYICCHICEGTIAVAITTKSLRSYGLDAGASGQDLAAAIFTRKLFLIFHNGRRFLEQFSYFKYSR